MFETWLERMYTTDALLAGNALLTIEEVGERLEGMQYCSPAGFY